MWRQGQSTHGFQAQRRDQQVAHAQSGIGELMNKRRVRAVFQQAAHQVGEQVFVRPHRRIHAADHQRVFQHLAVHALTHAVQALQLKRTTAARTHLHDGRYRGRVVGGKLGVDHIRRVQQRASASQV